ILLEVFFIVAGGCDDNEDADGAPHGKCDEDDPSRDWTERPRSSIREFACASRCGSLCA
ncbi:hypothetical protein BGW80DRAFT_1299835, partial [Lactifluus volemus]